ncbi:MAG: inner membrane protein YpjD [Rhodoferax sp.]
MILPSPADTGSLSALASVAAYLAPALASEKLGTKTSGRIAFFAWLAHAAALWISLFGYQPRFGFAAALSLTAWLAGLIYAIEIRLYPALQTRWKLAAFAAASVLLAWIFPGKLLHPGASVWLPLHWALGIASYGLVAVAVVHAWFMTRTEDELRLAANPAPGVPLMTLERLTFRFVQVGFLLLTATILIALFFADHLYGVGQGFKLTHKAIFSLLAWLVFAVLLLGRARFGWRGQMAKRMLYAGSALLLLAYAGSRFVLEVVLSR